MSWLGQESTDLFSLECKGDILIFLLYLLQVYGEGTGLECRKHVQHLNLMRKTMDEQVFVASDEGDCMLHDAGTVAVTDVDDPQNHVMNFIDVSQIYTLLSF